MFGEEEQRRKMRKLFGKKLNDDVDRQPGPDRIPVPNLTRTFIQVPDLGARQKEDAGGHVGRQY